ncbi:MAG: methyltransferase domain-containing protein [Candidatus Aminicenantes bacterium]|nr:methyltransferase domain-containing protein [Candidatus Aminicenantes bacterium]
MNVDYAIAREKRVDYRNQLNKRTKEVLKTIGKYLPSPQMIMDLGTAEGKMLAYLKKAFPSAFCLGVDSSFPLLLYGKKRSSDLSFIWAEAENLKFIQDETFDVIIAAAIIEHLVSPSRMLREAYRLLKPKGIIILTTPNPFWEKIARVLGFIKGEHNYVMFLSQLVDMCRKENFLILEAYGFMVSPIGIWKEDKIESFFKKVKLDKFLLNQMVVAQKP